MKPSSQPRIRTPDIAALVFAAVSFVVIGDTAGKLLTSQGIAPALVAWSRFFIAAVILLPLSGLSRADLCHFRDWRVLLRGGLITLGIFCILNALKTEPIANVFGAFFIGPGVSYILAILFLGERPSRCRSLLLVIGFIGVMFVVKPGFGAGPGMAFALAAGVCYGAYLAMTRWLAGDDRPRFLPGPVDIPPYISARDGFCRWIADLTAAMGSSEGQISAARGKIHRAPQGGRQNPPALRYFRSKGGHPVFAKMPGASGFWTEPEV